MRAALLGHLRRWMNTVTSAVLTRVLLVRAWEQPGVTPLPALVVAPHQDDETFGCAGIIALKRRLGVPVTVVFISDGSGSHREEGVTSGEIVAIREVEARAATSLLGVPSSDVHFLRYPDTQLSMLAPEVHAEVVSKLASLIQQHRELEVYVTHHRDMHPDHEGTCRMVDEAVAQSASVSRVIVWEYMVWLRWMGKFLRNITHADFPGLTKVPIHEALPLKLEAIQCYQSQVPALGRAMVSCFEIPWEIFVTRSSQATAATQPSSSSSRV